MIEVVAPAHMLLVQQVSQIRPGEGRGARGLPVWRIHRALAAHRIIRVRALRRPSRDRVQVGRQAPRSGRLEEVVLQHEILGVSPVVGDVTAHVIAHDVRMTGALALAQLLLGHGDEAVELPAVHVAQGTHPGHAGHYRCCHGGRPTACGIRRCAGLARRHPLGCRLPRGTFRSSDRRTGSPA